MKGPSLRRAGGLVAVGSAAGYSVSLALTPVLSRVVGPVEFGHFASMLAVASALTGLSTFRLEVRAQAESEEDRAAGLLRTALLAAAAWSTLITIIGVAAVLMGAETAWMMVGLMVYAASIQLVSVATCSRSRRYRELAFGNFGQGAGLGVAQTVFGAISSTAAALAGGFVAARLVWTQSLLRMRGAPATSTRWDSELAKYAGAAGSSAFISSLAGQAPLLLIAVVHGPAAAGAYGMASRLLLSPLFIVGQATAAASLGEVGRLLRGEGAAWPVVRSAMRDLFAVGLVPCVGAAVLGPMLAAQILGQQWNAVGGVLAALALGALAQFCVSPFAQLLNVTRHSRLLLVWDLARLLLVAAAIVGPAVANYGLVTSLWSYSAVLVVLYLVLGLVLCRVMTTSDVNLGPRQVGG